MSAAKEILKLSTEINHNTKSVLVLKHTTIRTVNGDVHVSFTRNNTMYDFYIEEEEFNQIIEEWFAPRTL